MSVNGKWGDGAVPKRGWEMVDSFDCGPDEDAWQICAMCEVQVIRFVHVMEHETYGGGALECGCICAGRMCDDPDRVIETETRLRQVASRRVRWLFRKAWKVSARGNRYINDRELHGVVYPVPARGGFGFLVEHRQTKVRMLASRKFMATEEEARLRLFDAMQWVRQRGGPEA
jgi:hypothetical protein